MPGNHRTEIKSYSFSSSSGSKTLERINQRALRLKKYQRGRSLNIESKFKVSVVGVSGVGVELVARIAQKQYQVIAVDKMSSIVRNICRTHFSETHEPLSSYLEYARSQKYFCATTDLAMAVKCSELSILSGMVLENEQRDSGVERITPNNIIVEIAQVLKDVSHYHTILFYGGEDISMINKTYIPFIEQISAKKLGRDFGVSSIIKKHAESSPFKSSYVKGFDKKSELNIRRLYKNTKIRTQYFDFSEAI